ncbi:MAG: C39 family peptidase [Desulfocapsaceae bacterium]|nr:C39 family peptidase [Desulfocapsaceae bacterium]
MESRFALDILSQPDDTTCGPTCLHAVYRYYGDEISLKQVVSEAHLLEGGGTLEVLLACHALRRGYRATIYTYNLQVFDPIWFENLDINLSAKLKQQIKVKNSKRLKVATKAYLEFLALGGKLRFKDLTTALLRKYLKQDKPILCGLSSTYLYHCAREFGPTLESDDIRGVPTGHFVILCGYDLHNRHVFVADPLKHPSGKGQLYEVDIDRLVGSILLGILTYDANLLIIEPPSRPGKVVK